MEHTSENQDPSDKQPKTSELLLQQIISDLAALKVDSERKNKTAKRQTLFYSGIFGLILGFCSFSVIQQGRHLQELESNQIMIKQTLQSINGEIAEELQRLDDLLNGEIPLDIQEPIIAEQVFLEIIAGKFNKNLP